MGQLNSTERAELSAHLESTRGALLDLVNGMSAAQWTWAPPESLWSAAQCAEHVLIVESSLLRTIQKLVDSGKVEPERGARLAGKEKKLVERIPARQVKVMAPEAMRPSGRFATPADFRGEFIVVRESTLSMALESTAPLHDLVEPHFALGDLTGAQWLWFISAHCQRHVNQLAELRSMPDFPAA